ncbi:MAG: hypothetical protein LUE27_00045 [Clostridia bacterium]|nr:hypothetical protein [Clostridia bacterium]
MGTIIPAKIFSPTDLTGLLKPIIYCCSYDGLDARALPINVPLARELLKYESAARTMLMKECFTNVVEEFPDDCTIKNFDVMFNPAYKIDVLGIMVSVCKIKPFNLIWSGTLDSNGKKLIYAENGFKDHTVYEIDDYDITCIAKK